MNIDEININGFGIFHKLKISELSPKLNIITGENEAGKTTLMEFVRSVLFGFNSKCVETLDGGELGGSLRINANETQWIIERYKKHKKKNIVARNIDNNTTCELKEILGHTTRSLYASIYAFGLSELQNFEALSKDDVARALYDTSAGVDLKRLHDFEKSLKTKREKLYKDAGRTQVIFNLLEKATKLQNELDLSNNAIIEYNKLFKEATEEKGKINEKENDLKSNVEKLDLTTTLLRCREIFNTQTEIENELKILIETSSALPENHETLWAALDLKRNKTTDELERISSEFTEATKNLKTLSINSELLELSQKCVMLRDNRNEYLKALTEMPKNEEFILSLKNEIADICKKLNIEDETLINICPSISTKTELENLKESAYKLNRILENEEEDFSKATRVAENAKHELENLIARKKELQALPKEVNEEAKKYLLDNHSAICDIAKKAHAIERDIADEHESTTTKIAEIFTGWSIEDIESFSNTQTLEQTKNNLCQELTSAQKNLDIAQQDIRSAEKEKELYEKHTSTSEKNTTIIGSLSIFSVCAILVALDFLAAVIALLIVAGCAYVFTRVIGKNKKKDNFNYNAQKEALKEKEVSLEAATKNWHEFLSTHNFPVELNSSAYDMLQVKIEHLKSIIKSIRKDENTLDEMRRTEDEYKDAAMEIPSLREMDIDSITKLQIATEAWFSTLENVDELKTRYKKASADIENATETLENAENILQASSAKFNKAKENYEQEQANWKKWLRQNNLNEIYNYDIAKEAIRGIEDANKKLSEIKELENKNSSIQNKLSNAMSTLNNLHSTTGKKETSIETLLNDIDNIIREYQSELENETKRNERQDLVNDLETKTKIAKELKNNADKKITDFLSSYNIDSETEKDKLFDIHNKIINLDVKLKSAQQQLKTNAENIPIHIIEENLKNASQTKLDEQLKTLRQTIAFQEEEIKTFAKKHTELSVELNRLKLEDEIKEKKWTLAQLKEDIHKRTLEFAKIAITEDLLKSSRSEFKKSQHEKVFNSANEFLKTLTNGNYVKIETSNDDKTPPSIIDKNNLYKNAKDELSTGTAQALYLAIRLGHITQRKDSTALPIIIDDILVNFDPKREVSATKAIQQLTATNQVLYFTCHPETVKKLQETNPDAKVINIDNGSVIHTSYID